ncbi:MAG: SDR family NAD(P)-dependent oxidoreductase [Gemmatimonadaceae bacterium]|jgi:NAD(P)-dependent dehydrogenase (short-subunit alcohol dehydrogenase family)|nr:SDR family NAD(P)-dependent oxidoreductase [Gemmatimonadaceae bacterium]
MSKVWVITGASRGFGLEFAKAALERGDRVVATARRLEALASLAATYGEQVLPLTLDVTDGAAARAAIAHAAAHFGRIDVLVNNAGYGLFGAVEEITADQLRAQLEVNLIGVLHLTQAVLPVMREQGTGHIIMISSVGGVVAFPNLGGYHASKWALEGLTESLSQEVADFGIRTTLVEPGPYVTDWPGSSATHAEPMPAYEGLRAASRAQAAQMPVAMYGQPAAAAAALLCLVDSERPPLRALFGTMPTQIVPAVYQSRLATWADWQALAVEAHG